MKMIKGEIREQLKSLSKEIFGSSSKWQKILEKGMIEQSTETVTEYVPNETGDDGTTREVKVPVNYKNSQTPVFTRKHYTAETLLAHLQEVKAQRDAFLKFLKDKQDEEAAKKAAAEHKEKVAQSLEGSAL